MDKRSPSTPPGSCEWIYLNTRGAGTDEVYGRYRHVPCGTELEIAQGYAADICPTCQPEEWAKAHSKK